MKYISILMVPCLKEMKPKFQFSIVDFFLETEYGEESGPSFKTLFIDAHLDRLFNSAKGIDLKIDFTRNEIILKYSKSLIKIE